MPNSVNDNMYYTLQERYGGNLHLGDYLARFVVDNPSYLGSNIYDFYRIALGYPTSTTKTYGDLEYEYWDLTGRALTLLGSATLWLDANRYDGAAKWKNLGTGGSVLDAQLGSTAVGWGAWVESGALNLKGVAANYASTPDAAAIRVTGDAEWVFHVKAKDWTPVGGAGGTQQIMAKRGASVAWSIGMSPSGQIQFVYREATNTTTRLATPGLGTLTDNTAYWVKLTRSAATGDVSTYVQPSSPAEPSSWGAAVSVVSTPVENINAGTAPIEVGTRDLGTVDPFEGVVYRAIHRNGIGGTSVFDANFANVATGATSFTESSSNAATVTINRTAVSGGGGNYGTYIGNGELNLPGDINNYASVPDSAALDITGDITLEFWGNIGRWGSSASSNSGLISKMNGGQMSYSLGRASGTRRLDFRATSNGSTTRLWLSTVDVPSTAVAVKVDVDVDNGSSQAAATFSYRDSTGDWVALDTVVAGGTLSTWVGTSSVYIGYNPMTGYEFLTCTRAVIRSGIAGTVVFDANFTIQPDGTTSFRESSSNAAVVTVNSTYNDTNDPLFLRGESAGYVYLPGVALNNCSIPAAANLDVAGDFEVAFAASAADWTPTANGTLVSKWTTTGNQRSWVVELSSTGALTFYSSSTGSNVFSAASSVATGATDGSKLYVKVDFRALDGRVRFFTSPTSLTSGFVQLGTDVISTGGPHTLFASTSPLLLGQHDAGASGLVATKIHRAIVKDGIGGSTVLDVDFSTLTEANQSTFVCQTGQTVSFNRSTSGRKLVVMPAGGKSRWLFGTDDYMEIADNDLLEVPAGQDFSVLAVVRPFATLGGNAAIVSKWPGGGAGWQLYTDGGATFTAKALVGDSGALAFGSAGSSPYGTTTLRTLVRDVSADKVRGYIGSSLVVDAADTTTLTSANIYPTRIGSIAPGGSYFDGEIVAVVFFRRALTATELALIASYYGAA